MKGRQQQRKKKERERVEVEDTRAGKRDLTY